MCVRVGESESVFTRTSGHHYRGRRELLERFSRRLPENGSSQGQNLALTLLRVPNLLESAHDCRHRRDEAVMTADADQMTA